MTPDDFISAVHREGIALARSAETGPDRNLRSYPHWTVLDLVAHTGSVHRWVGGIVSARAQREPERRRHDDRRPNTVFAWFRDGLDALVQILAEADPTEPVWTMATDRSVGFWGRRMAHETAAHRWDVEDAVGSAAPIDPDLALTGIAETLEIHFVQPLQDALVGGSGEQLLLHCVDVPGDWVVRLLPDRVEVDEGPGAAEATIAGTASDLWLTVMGRRIASVEVRGDRRSVDAFDRALHLLPEPAF